MKITELLNENDEVKKPASSLPTSARAASIGDLDKPDSDLDIDDLENTEDDEPDFKDIRAIGGKLGHDLYAITMYRYDDAFLEMGPGEKEKAAISKYDEDPVVQAYLDQDVDDLGGSNTISALIFNERNGAVIRVNAGAKNNLKNMFTPDLRDLIKDDLLDPDQLPVLKKIANSAYDYIQSLDDHGYWRPGTEPRDEEVAENMLDLMVVLRLNDVAKPPPEPVRKIDPETARRNKESSARIKANREEFYKKWIKQQEEQSAPREKR